jgi:COP9 signalosome complex subunit 7
MTSHPASHTNVSQPFLALTKSTSTPRQAADLVTRATSAPNTYLFTELLQSPQIQSLSSSPEYSSHLTLLQIFSHGTYTTYTSTPDLPPLSPQQTLKLRQLSLLTLAKDRELSYSSLISKLGLSSARELEDIVTSSIYASLINATLDPAHETVHIHSVAPLRDVSPTAIPDLLSSLKSWASRCEAALADLNSRVATIRATANARAQSQTEWDARVAKLVEDEFTAGPAAFLGFGSAEAGQHGHGLGGGFSQGLPARGPGGQQSQRTGRYGKRGSGHMDGVADEVDDEAMDLDEEDDGVGEKKRTSRRKLLG